MGTHCYIGLEDKESGVTQYIYIHYDGYFSHIVEVLRKHYMNRQNVEHLISCGNRSVLQEPSKLTKNDDEDDQAILAKNRYDFHQIARREIEYCYLFTKEDKWECSSREMFSIDELKY
jgi:hypothetical protein